MSLRRTKSTIISWQGSNALILCCCIFILWLQRLWCQTVLTNWMHNWNIRYNWAATWQNQQCECAPSEDSDQSGHPPSLIRVFAVRMKKAWILSYPLSAQRRLWSDWADAQADLNLRWAHSHFVGFCHVAAHISTIYWNFEWCETQILSKYFWWLI